MSQAPRRSVLVTRPPPGLGETLCAVAAAGWRPLACPVMRIVPLPHAWPAPERVAAILLTSRQVLPALVAARRSRPGLGGLAVFAVGDRTAMAAREAGFAQVESAAGEATALAALVAGRLPADAARLPLLLPVGRGQGATLVAALAARGLAVQRVEVYAQQAVAAFDPAVAAALQEAHVAAALFFSGESARLFADLCPAALRPVLGHVRALAISSTAAAPLAGLPWRSREIARHPDAASLLALLGAGDTTTLERTS